MLGRGVGWDGWDCRCAWLGSLPTTNLHEPNKLMSLGRILKRGMDVAGAGLALLLFSPLLAVIAVGVRRSMGKPVLFRQTRPGLGGKPFEMVKFRTMRDTCDNDRQSFTG